jgi:hypothetical protein
MTAKCPYCKSVLTHLEYVGLDAGESGRRDLRSIAFVCSVPSCRAVLGAQIDPIAVKTDTLNAIRKELNLRDQTYREDSERLAHENQQILRQLLKEVEDIKKKIR